MSDARTNILKSSYDQGLWHKIYFRQTQNILKKLINANANFYLKPTDIISHRPTLFGYHEPHLEVLFENISKTHNDFFLDIGANIGLSTVISGAAFKDLHCVEPNRTLAKILDVNLELSGLSHKTTIHTVALGRESKVEKLWIPRTNFGGAFIKQGNSYDGHNDKVQRPMHEDYIIQNVQLVDARKWFLDLFGSHNHWRRGFVKIDVEGLELPILEALLQTLPRNVSVALVMENFLSTVNLERFTAPHHNLEWFGVYKVKDWVKSIPLKLLGMSSYYVQKVEVINQQIRSPHDLIVLASCSDKKS